MRKVKDAIDLTTNEKIYFKGHAKATFMSDGKTVEDAINEMGTGSGGIAVETDPIFSASPAASITEEKKTEWDNKVDKVSGKQLSTEDFTSALKSKLEGLSNYDDTELSEAMATLRQDFDKLVNGDTTTAIKTFNEVIAFLDGIQDSQDLSSIIASIEQQIAGKQDKLVSGENIKTVNGQSLLGNGDIVIGGCESLTYEEFVSKVNNNELVEGSLYRITDYETVVAGDLTTAPDHGFDLIVLATSSNSYSNKCWAAPTDRFQYPPYPNCQLDKWQIWWSHERTNQIWVPETGHKGVIYRMIDEWGNDCPYDFKSIMFKVPNIASEVNGTLGTVGSLANFYFHTFTIMIDGEMLDASVHLNSFEDYSTFCKNNVIKSSIVDGYNDEDSSPFPYVMFLASCGDTYSDLSSKRIYNNVIGESTTCVLFFAECNYFNFSNNSIGKNSSNIRLIARQDDLQNNGNILYNNFKDNCEFIFLEASDISNNSIDSSSYDIRIPTTEGIPRTPYQSISDLRIGKNVGSISTDFGVEKQEYVYLTDLHVGDSSYDIRFTSSYGTPIDGFYTNIGKKCQELYIDLTYSPTINIGDRCTNITVNGICTIGDGCSAIEYSSETGASQLTFNSGVHDLFINPLDGIKATVIAGSPTGSADDIVDETVAKPENGPDNADYLLYVNGQNKWVAEPIMSLDKTVKYTEDSLRTIKVDLLNDGMVYALPLGSEEAKAEADCVLQEKIDDLDDIRRGAAKGATALQSYTEQYKGTITGVSANGTSVATSGVANIPAASTSAYGVTKLTSAVNSTSTTLAATASAVKTAYDLANNYKGTVTGVKINGSTKNPSNGVVDLGTVITSHQDISGKQDKLVSGTNIKTINGESILGEGDIVISGGGSSQKEVIELESLVVNISDMLPNTIYYRAFHNIASLTIISFTTSESVVDEYVIHGCFNDGGYDPNSVMSITLPENVLWANGNTPIVMFGEYFELSILRIGTIYKAVLTTFKSL